MTYYGAGKTIKGDGKEIFGKNHVIIGDSNTIGGSGHHITGRNNTILGTGHTIIGIDNKISGDNHTLNGRPWVPKQSPTPPADGRSCIKTQYNPGTRAQTVIVGGTFNGSVSFGSRSGTQLPRNFHFGSDLDSEQSFLANEERLLVNEGRLLANEGILLAKELANEGRLLANEGILLAKELANEGRLLTNEGKLLANEGRFLAEEEESHIAMRINSRTEAQSADMGATFNGSMDIGRAAGAQPWGSARSESKVPQSCVTTEEGGNIACKVPEKDATRLDVKVSPAGDDSNACVICLESERRCLALPCGHFMFCVTCSRTIGLQAKSECPICKTVVTSFELVYT